MTNQQLVDRGNKMMDETDEAIERSKKVSFSLKDQMSAFFLLDFEWEEISNEQNCPLVNALK